jgi:hypothetical protein
VQWVAEFVDQLLHENLKCKQTSGILLLVVFERGDATRLSIEEVDNWESRHWGCRQRWRLAEQFLNYLGRRLGCRAVHWRANAIDRQRGRGHELERKLNGWAVWSSSLVQRALRLNS